MADDRFKDLVNLTSKISDFVQQAEGAVAEIDETHGVAVILDRDEEEEVRLAHRANSAGNGTQDEEEDLDVIADDNNDEEEGEEAAMDSALHTVDGGLASAGLRLARSDLDANIACSWRPHRSPRH